MRRSHDVMRKQPSNSSSGLVSAKLERDMSG